ncbi:MAG: conjugal transfer protein TraH [Deltaproteobacteria bacterium]|nr:conjugal transfer protein TraH [Deltaproteobacteria bacterium]MBW1987667.1 conjugal transfer protein TraH [Deltaproteobacteria bacterium]
MSKEKSNQPCFQGRKLAAALLALVFLCNSAVARASLQSEMQGLFNTMTNVSDGGYYKGMGRGVVTGPSVVMRNNRVRTDIFNFVPPSIDAGCGGIDMFLGAFSFIDADQFVNLLQAIAANAAGYAFKLALSTMCPTCDEAITSLQRVMQKLNAMAGDSCRLAQAGVDILADSLGASELGRKLEDGPIAGFARSVGQKADAFSAYLDKINAGSSTKSLTDDEIKALLGNAAWKVLKKNSYVSSAFLSGDNELAEALMSVTGTVVGVKGSGDVPLIYLWEPILEVKDLLDGAVAGAGAKPRKYQCLDADCMEITVADYDFKGLEQLVKEVLLGNDLNFGSDSFVFKLAFNSGTLTDQEKRLIRMAPYHMARLRNIAVCAGAGNKGSLEPYAQKAARLIALEVLEKYLKDATVSIMQATQGSGTDINGHNVADALMPKYRTMIAKVQENIRNEHRKLGATLTTDLEQIYQSAIQNCNLKPAYIVNPMSVN